ncbi:unnamed protein product [Adineta ricciae]|uniref:ZNF451 PIN-like domain-containing protein n=1 Tax=Adineta ricciae TaxID=249248 RepID=A0A815LMA7_ADIRI|nr:unnamed protein product [Adineta ricciae]
MNANYSPDMWIRVSNFNIDQLSLVADDFNAHVDLSIKVANLLSIKVNAGVSVNKVNLSSSGTNATIELAVNFDRMMKIITQTLDSVDLNSLSTRSFNLLSIFTEHQHIIYQIITEDGKIINQIFGSMGELLLSTTVGDYRQNMTYIGISNKSPNGYTTNQYHYRPPSSSLTCQNVLINITFDTVVSVNSNIFQQRSPIKHENQDKDSLQLDNLHYLATMKHLLFLDLENFSNFFQHLTHQLPDQTYVIAFTSSNNQWKPPKNNLIYENLIKSDCFQLMHPAGSRHDAADFALVLTFGKLHGLLPKSISFTIISGDKGFLEIIHQLKDSQRKISWFNPHLTSLEKFNTIFHF